MKRKTYPFNRLRKFAKENALKDLRERESTWWNGESTIDYWREKLSDIGISDAQIYFRGFWSQGDGAWFSGYVDLKKLVESHPSLVEHSLAVRRAVLDDMFYGAAVKERGRPYTMSFEFNYYTVEPTAEFEGMSSEDFSALVEDGLKDFEVNVEELVRDLAHQIYKDLKSDYDSSMGDEYLIESAIVNEWEFYASGEIA